MPLLSQKMASQAWYLAGIPFAQGKFQAKNWIKIKPVAPWISNWLSPYLNRKKVTNPISSPLFSHFPTEITLPLPVVCHATLELEQNRKRAQHRRSNAYVLKQLAKFLAEIAEVRAKLNPDGTKAGFRILMNLQDYPLELTRDSFEENFN